MYELRCRVNPYGKGGLGVLDHKGRAHAFWTELNFHDRYVGARIDHDAHRAEKRLVLHYSDSALLLRCADPSELSYYRRAFDEDVLLPVDKKTCSHVGQPELRDADAVIAAARASAIQAWRDAYDSEPLCEREHPKGGATPPLPSALTRATTTAVKSANAPTLYTASATAPGEEH